MPDPRAAALALARIGLDRTLDELAVLVALDGLPHVVRAHLGAALRSLAAAEGITQALEAEALTERERGA